MSAKQHRAFEREWKAKSGSWVSMLLYPMEYLAGTHQTSANLACFHGNVAAQYELLDQGYGNAQQADKLDWCVGRVMQHAAYDCNACKGIVTKN